MKFSLTTSYSQFKTSLQMRTVVFWFCLVFVFAVDINATNGSSKGTSPTGRIVGGDPVQITQYPYQAHLQRHGQAQFSCGGSIISEDYILTAAHCVHNYPIEFFEIRVGTKYFWEGGQLFNVTEKFVYPQYDSITMDYDAAVLKLSKKIIINNNTTKIIKLAESGSSLTPGDYVKVSGWGIPKEDGNLTTVLRAVAVPVISPKECAAVYNNYLIDFQFTNHMFCAGFPKGGKDSCLGDSGGPAVHVESEIQYGVVSWGTGCARAKYPGVYTLVPAVRDWIKKVTGI